MGALGKVIVRTRDGKVHPGFAAKDDVKEQFRILTPQSKEQTFDLKEVKAIFFVKDLQGDPRYEEIKFLNKQPVSKRIWVRVVLFDGEVLEGAIKNNGEVLDPMGFHLWPSDRDTNNESVFIPKSALKGLTILATE